MQLMRAEAGTWMKTAPSLLIAALVMAMLGGCAIMEKEQQARELETLKRDNPTAFDAELDRLKREREWDLDNDTSWRAWLP